MYRDDNNFVNLSASNEYIVTEEMFENVIMEIESELMDMDFELDGSYNEYDECIIGYKTLDALFNQSQYDYKLSITIQLLYSSIDDDKYKFDYYVIIDFINKDEGLLVSYNTFKDFIVRYYIIGSEDVKTRKHFNNLLKRVRTTINNHTNWIDKVYKDLMVDS